MWRSTAGGRLPRPDGRDSVRDRLGHRLRSGGDAPRAVGVEDSGPLLLRGPAPAPGWELRMGADCPARPISASHRVVSGCLLCGGGPVVSVGVRGHAFISYVREDGSRVDRLQRVLERSGIPVWRDTRDLWPGQDWRLEIRRAIVGDGLAFVACFSEHSEARVRSYQYEELRLAVDELRQRRPDLPWLIPVRFSECRLPEFDLGGGRTLDSLQRLDLFGERWDEQGERLVGAIRWVLGYRRPGAGSPEPASTRDHREFGWPAGADQELAAELSGFDAASDPAARRLADAGLRADDLLGEGRAAEAIAVLEDALAMLTRNRWLADRLDPESRVGLHQHLAEAYADASRHSDAIGQLQASRRLAHKHGLREDEHDALGDLHGAYLNQGRRAEADRAWREMMELPEPLHDPASGGGATVSIGAHGQESRETEGTETRLRRQADAYSALGQPHNQASVLMTLCSSLQHSGDWIAAKHAFEDARAALQDSADPVRVRRQLRQIESTWGWMTHRLRRDQHGKKKR
jgi:tetratricopeptide (TPR) repeat protein